MENVPVGPNSKPLRPVIVTEVSVVGNPRFLLRLTRIFYHLIHSIIHCFIMPSAIARLYTLTTTHPPFRAVWRNVDACCRQSACFSSVCFKTLTISTYSLDTDCQFSSNKFYKVPSIALPSGTDSREHVSSSPRGFAPAFFHSCRPGVKNAFSKRACYSLLEYHCCCPCGPCTRVTRVCLRRTLSRDGGMSLT
jgi:hypothetical protein